VLFRAASETLLDVAKNPKHLGAKIGFFSILHTWTQRLDFHPHVHIVVPGGGIHGSEWIPAKGKSRFFLPVKVLSRVFRGKFIAFLRNVASKTPSIDVVALEKALSEAARTEWVVYIKAPFRGPDVVLKYLSRYTHRVAISNQRILSLKDGIVSIRARRTRGSGTGVLRLEATEFLRRFLLHRVPKQFTRIRYFGFLANRGRRETLAKIKKALSPKISKSPRLESRKPWLLCPVCAQSNWTILFTIPRVYPYKKPLTVTFPIGLAPP
jgi:hypothetical protein